MVGGRVFQEPDPESEVESEDSTRVTLADLDLTVGSMLTYEYDFGDGWEHDIVVERLVPMPQPNSPAWTPRVMDGARAAPPEDSGGAHGFEQLVAALSDPDHPEHEECRQWVGPHYDPSRCDVWALDHALSLAVGWGAI